MIIFAPTNGRSPIASIELKYNEEMSADMVKLVDMPDLGSGAARRVGSSPIIRTKASQSRSFFYTFNWVLRRLQELSKLESFVKPPPRCPLYLF